MTHRALSLYRNILRAHRTKLPSQLRYLGDGYVRNEFQLHKSVTDTNRLQLFYHSWEQYVITLDKQPPVKNGQVLQKFGRDLTPDESAKLSSEQLEKLEEFKAENNSLIPVVK